jgi:HSP20 family protein
MTPYRSRDLFSLVDELLSDFPLARSGSMWLRAPAADVVERENEIEVTLELPGVRPEDVEVSLEGNVLTVAGEKKEERTEGDERGTWHLAERRYGRFTRSFVLPRDVEADKIEASYEHGLLRIRIPKAERARRRRIEIRGGQTSSGEVQG